MFAISVDIPGAAVRVTEAAAVSGPGAGRAGNVRPQPAHLYDPTCAELAVRHHVQTEAQEAGHIW